MSKKRLLAMPQPLKKNTTVDFRGNAIEARPVLAKHIGIIVGLWAELDERRARLLSNMLKIEARLATSMYISIESDGGKQAILTAVVNERFPDLSVEFVKLNKSISNTAKERNKVIHGIWGLSNQNTETLILDDPRNAVKCWASVHENTYRIISGQPPYPPEDVIVGSFQSLREYTERDFIDIENRIKERNEELRLFGLKIFKRNIDFKEQ